MAEEPPDTGTRDRAGWRTAPDALVITGATATGKTALSIEVARALGGEIISMDSRQVYQGMDIGTAKPTAAQLAAVPHHGIDIVPVDHKYSAGRFAADASRWMNAIRERGRIPILVGGTGFFLRALTHPMFQEPELAAERRAALHDWLKRKPTEQLLGWMDVLDPELGTRFRTEGGRQRILRALEIVLLTGRPLGWWQQHAPPVEAPLRPVTFVLELPREELYRRINERVIEMIGQGLVEEVRALMQSGYDERAPGMNATGYIELVPSLRGGTDLASAIDAIQRATRRYARRQHTWFRHQLPDGAVRLDAQQPRPALVESIVNRWNREVSFAHRN